jgi:acetate CoA/acetoacetate CoA-transferase beta subunit
VVNVVTEHCSKDGATKLVKKCTYPLTGAGVADVIITERALFRRYPNKGFVLEEVARGYTVDDIAACTDMDYVVSETVALDAFGPEV